MMESPLSIYLLAIVIVLLVATFIYPGATEEGYWGYRSRWPYRRRRFGRRHRLHHYGLHPWYNPWIYSQYYPYVRHS